MWALKAGTNFELKIYKIDAANYRYIMLNSFWMVSFDKSIRKSYPMVAPIAFSAKAFYVMG